MNEKINKILELLSNPIVTLLIGALVGFILSILKDFINDIRKNNKEKKEIALKKLDEAFLFLSKSSDKTRQTFSKIIDSNNKETQFNEASTKLAFIIRVHFPHLYDKYMEFINIEFEYGTYQVQSAVSILNLFEKQDFNQQLHDNEIIKYLSNDETINLMFKYQKSFGEFCTALVDEAKKIQM